MCGISGIYHYNNKSKPVNERLLNHMLDIIEHRGPDDDGVFFDRGLGMGMRRLSIIDLAGGKQPMFNEDGTVVIVFNGEIYNYRELAEDLEKRGHTLQTNSDTEVIVHLYEDYGEACVEHLRGMFAFALWDKRQQKLLVVRDRLGIKPLYYTEVGGQLIFGSEIKSLLLHPQVYAELNIEALSNFLSLKYVPAPQTLFASIYSLPPGSMLISEGGGIEVRSYWDISFSNEREGLLSEEAYAEKLEDILRESVRLRLRSDVPFGAFLSGGIDSSIIVALMSQFLNEPVKTFSVGFASEGSELPYARLIADKYQTDHYEVFVTPQSYLDLAEKITWHMDQPIADQATIATYMVSGLASQHVKMVLTGEGADELFAGYARYAGERFSPLFRKLPHQLRSQMLAMSNRLPGLRRPKLALYALCQADETTRFTNWFPLANQDLKEVLMSSSLRGQLNGFSTNDVFAQQLVSTNAQMPLNRMLYTDTKLWLPDFLLLRGDKLTMAASLEARVPFLDHKLVEFAAALPTHFKLKRLTRKYLLRKVGRNLLPKQIIERKKNGFDIPINRWTRNELRPFIRDMLAPTSIRKRGLFESAAIEKLLTEHESGFADHSPLLWGLANIEIWHRLFIDGQQSLQEPSPSTLVLETGAANQELVS